MDNKKKNAATAMTAILAASIVVNPMAAPVYAQETDTTVIEQQTEQEDPIQTPNEESDSQKTEDVPAVTEPEEDISATDTEGQTDIPETPKEETPSDQPEEQQKEAPNMMLRSTPVPKTAEDVEINEVNFPDEAFRTWLKGQYFGIDGKLAADEIADTTIMYIAGREDIKDLKGIEYFTALESLYCNGTGITNLDLSQNTAVTTLDCHNTEITSLDVSHNKALTYLYCSYTGITSLDVSKNTALETLYCSNAKLTSLDVSQNTALTNLDCRYNPGIISLDVSQSTALTTLYCSSTGIEKLDVSQNTALKDLRCGNTKIKKLDVSRNMDLITLECAPNREIKELDVSQNTALTSLDCGVTGIESLDVSHNTALESLDCGSTKITNLDVSQNTALKSLDCSDSKITSLDVSQNTALETLQCKYCLLAWLNIGNNMNLTTVGIPDSIISIKMTEDTFQITDIFEDIDQSKVTIIKGASYDSSTGTVSNYYKDIPIKYTYDCGTSTDGTQQTLSVELHLKGLKDKSSISITGDLSKTYDRTAVSDNPEVTKTGSTGAVTYKWEKKKSNGNWEGIPSAPVDAGTYRVTATLASDADYKEAVSAPVVFTIEQAENEWTENPYIADWTYQETANVPRAAAKYGKPAFTYSNSRTGTFSPEAPTTAGTWYVKATVAGTDNYTKLEDVQPFTIAKADSTIDIMEILDKTYNGTAVNDKPEFTSTGSTGAVTYKWEKKESDSDWKGIPSAPVDAGIYRVTATLASNDNYKEASSKPVEFTIGKAAAPQVVEPDNLSAVQDDMLSSIDLPNGWTWADKDTMVTAANSGYKARLTVDDSNYDYTGTNGYSQSGHYVERTLTVTVSQGQNAWVTEPSISNWAYGEAASTPQGSAEHGTVTFTYCSSETGTFSADVPTTAGTWYMKASVPASSEYTGLNKIIAFTIEPKNTEADSQITVPDITDGTDLGNLTLKDGDKELVQGTDYDVTKEQDGDKVTVTITFKGNYRGTITKTYTVDTDKPGSDKTDTDKPSGDKTDTGNKGDTGNKKNTDKKGNTGGAVQTGDTACTGLWTMLLALSAGLTAVLVGKKRKTTAEDGEEI